MPNLLLQKITLILITAITLWLPSNVLAWGMTGHRVVGEVADFYLSVKARAAIKKIIGNERLALAANWADFIKSDTSFKYMDSWHYVNLPAGLNKEGVFNYLDTEKVPNIYNKTLEMIAVLKNPKSTLAQKQLALRLVIHFIGDMNQPMHVARKDDQGGNRVNVFWFNEKTNLHRIWDSQLIDYQQLSYSEYARAINDPSPIQLVNWKKSTIKDAVYESYEACNKIYSMTKPDDKLSYRYNFDFADILNVQLLKGGIRLAQVLNNIYGI
ncbi:MAG: S1/P1 Nuclease [Pedobacter sp.]|nr:MAG: S1/P1 Nuclease [Pedobacter sp.]